MQLSMEGSKITTTPLNTYLKKTHLYRLAQHLGGLHPFAISRYQVTLCSLYLLWVGVHRFREVN